MTQQDFGLRATASWNRTGRFWLAWPPTTGHRPHDLTARDDSVALAQLLAAHAPVTAVAASADVVPCSQHMPAGVRTLAAAAGAALLSPQPIWLSDGNGALHAGVGADCAHGAELARAAGVDRVDLPAGWRADLLETDGEGTALVSNRLAEGMAGGRDEAERLLRSRLGILRVIWLSHPGQGRLPARYLAPAVVAVPTGAHGHPAQAALQANRDRLRAGPDRRGRTFKVVELPCPSHPEACYSDCMVAGDLVVVPQLDKGSDLLAFDRIVAAVPTARVVAFPAAHLAWPAGRLNRAVLAQPKPH